VCLRGRRREKGAENIQKRFSPFSSSSGCVCVERKESAACFIFGSGSTFNVRLVELIFMLAPGRSDPTERREANTQT
jgi:hypothetical protein